MSRRKKKISKTTRRAVWEQYAGKNDAITNCWACYKELNFWDFECGHVIPESKGGPTVVENLRPVHGSCNKSMQTINLEEYHRRMKEAGVIEANRRLNSITSTNDGFRHIEAKEENFDLNQLMADELIEICKFYGVKQGKNKAEYAKNIMDHPKFNSKTFAELNKKRKILEAFKESVLHNIWENLTKDENKSILHNGSLVSRILLNFPNFDHVDYCSKMRKRDGNKRTKSPDKEVKFNGNANGNKVDSKSESRGTIEILKSGYRMKYVPFSENNDEKAILMARFGENIWKMSYSRAHLEFMTSEDFDKMVQQYLTSNVDSKFNIENGIIKISLEDPNNNCNKIILALEPVIDETKCSCGERLDRLEKILKSKGIINDGDF